MTATQVEYASVIRSSGNDLLELLNSILDLAKVESGTVTARHGRRLASASSATALLREFEPSPAARASATRSTSRPAAPTTIVTDPQRLRQILKNLLANAFKFTERGTVHVQVGLADSGWNREHRVARRGRVGGRLLGHRHRHRHRRRAAAADLRGVRPGRRHHRPPLRRHRARALDQPRAGRAARRRDHRRQHARAGQHLHRLPPGRAGAPRSPRRRLRACPHAARSTPVAARPGAETGGRARRQPSWSNGYADGAIAGRRRSWSSTTTSATSSR